VNSTRNRQFANAIVSARRCDRNVGSRAVDAGTDEKQQIAAFDVSKPGSLVPLWPSLPKHERKQQSGIAEAETEVRFLAKFGRESQR
jgi:hypothetical protein